MSSLTTQIGTDSEALSEYEAIFQNAIIGISILKERVFIRCNRKLEEIFGYDKDELTGQSVRILYPDQESFESVGRMDTNLEKNKTCIYEHEMLHKSGKTIWCLFSGQILDQDQKWLGAVWVVQDVTDKKLFVNHLKQSNNRLQHNVNERTKNLRKINKKLNEEIDRRRKTEIALVESREKYRVLYNNFPIGIAITDSDINILEINNTLMSFFNISSTIEFKNIKNLINNENNLITMEELIESKLSIDLGHVARTQIGVTRPNGKYSWYSVVASHVYGSGLTLTFQDITEQKIAMDKRREQRAELARSARLSLMGQFTSVLTHELGQPLNASMSYLQGLILRIEKDIPENYEYHKALNITLKHIERAGSIVNQVRDFLTKHTPDYSEVDMHELLDDVINLLDFELKPQHAKVRLNFSSDVPPINLCKIEIQQVIINIVMNAIEAMIDVPVDNKFVDIYVHCSETWLSIIISDQGPGVSDGNKIFSTYYTTKPNGLGMGLAICESIIESHEGTLSLSNNKKNGAEFLIKLPFNYDKK